MFYILLFKIGLLGHYISSDSYYVYYIGKQKKVNSDSRCDILPKYWGEALSDHVFLHYCTQQNPCGAETKKVKN